MPVVSNSLRNKGNIAPRLKSLILLIVLSDIFTGAFALFTGMYTGYEQTQKLITLIPGMISRCILLLYISRYIFRHVDLALIVFIIALLPIFTEIIILIKYDLGPSSFILGLIYSYKMICIYSVYVFSFKFKNKVEVKNITDAFIIAFFLYTLSILIGYMTGYEYSTYGGKGSSGLLIKGSANSLSMVFIAMFSLVLTRIKFKIIGLMLSIYTLFVSLILMTKVAVFGVLIISTLWFYYNSKSKFLFFLIVAFLLVTVGSHLVSLALSSNLYERMIFVYENYSLIGLILSGRDHHFTIGWSIYSSSNVEELLFGLGYDNFRKIMGTYFGEPIGVEIDFFDLLFKNGVVFTFLYLLPIGYVILKSITKKNVTNNYRIVRASYILLVLISFISGHILMSGLNGYVLPLISIILIRGNNENTNDI